MSDYERFGKEVAELLRIADGEPIFGRALDLDEAAVLRQIRLSADEYEVEHRHLTSPSPAPPTPPADGSPTEPHDVDSGPSVTRGTAVGGGS